MIEVHRYVAEYHQWFYLITVAWTFFEGESFVLLAGAVAAQGTIDPVLLCVCAWIGSYLGDQCWFFLGRYFGHLVVRRFPEWRTGIDTVHRWLDRWDVLFILTFRFIYGIRNFSSAAIGLSEFSTTRFMILNFVSAGIWAVSFVGIGYLFGHAIVRIMGEWASDIELGVLCLFAVVVIGGWGYGRYRRYKAKDAARRDAAAKKAARKAATDGAA
jgi:membrane protein DedA with SNARE-associated domain